MGDFMEERTSVGSFDIIKNKLQDTELIILDFSVLMFMTNTKLLDMLAEFTSESDKKVVISEDFLQSYKIVAESTSKEQRTIAESAKKFVNDLNKKRVLFHSEKFPNIRTLVSQLASSPKVAIFISKDSVADEVLRTCVNPEAIIFAVLPNGRICCEKSNRYLANITHKVSDVKSDNSAITVPDLPISGSTVKTRDNTIVTLGKVIDRGAEGAVYNTDIPGYVCKIYHQKQMTINKIKKLENFEKRQVKFDGICWPEKMVFTPEGYPAGYIMQRADGSNLADVFDGEEMLLEKFPDWKKIDVVKTAISVFKKIEYLHLLGIVVGDIRPQNIMIDDNGNTYLIDMDSCQIDDFPCAFGDEDYTPAEYQGKAFSSFLRSYYGEDFSCWTLCFFILFLGQHPYAQRNGADSIAEDIAAHAFPYPKDFNGDYEKVPIGDYKAIWCWLPDVLRDAFYKTFLHDNRTPVLGMIQLLEEYEEYLSELPNHAPDMEIVPVYKPKTEPDIDIDIDIDIDDDDIFSGALNSGTSKPSGPMTGVYNPGGSQSIVTPGGSQQIVNPGGSQSIVNSGGSQQIINIPNGPTQSKPPKKKKNKGLIAVLVVLLILLWIYLVALIAFFIGSDGSINSIFDPIEFLVNNLSIYYPIWR